MGEKYRINSKLQRSKKRPIYIVASISLVILIIIAFTLVYLVDHTTGNEPTVNGQSTVVGQITGNSVSQTMQINEPYFTMSLPSGWQQTNSVNNQNQDSITWQSKVPGADNRWLTIYIDKIPTTMGVNELLPVVSNGSTITYQTLSDNCSNFTPAAGSNPADPVLAKWENVSFYCNLPDRFDNQVGTGSSEGINTVEVTGQESGSHNYFFLYTDHNAQPDYSILYTALTSFQAK